jgi:hypothetical protein
MRLLLSSILIVAACGKSALPGHSVPTSPVESRTAPAVLLNDGRVLLAGGTTCSATFPPPLALNGLVYDPASDSWTSTGPLVTPRAGASAHLLPDGRVLLAGGDDEHRMTFATSEIFDPATLAWTPGPDLPMQRSKHDGFTLADGTVIIAGGRSFDTISAQDFLTADILAPGASAWRTVQLSGARPRATNILLPDGSLLAAGGSGFRVDYSDVVRVDLNTGVARPVARMPAGRILLAHHSLADGRTLFLSPPNFLIFDPAADTWTAGTDDLAFFLAHTLLRLPDGRVMSFGGDEYEDLDQAQSSDDPKFVFNRVHAFDPRTARWSDSSELLVDRESPAATLLRDGRVLVAGGQDGLFQKCDAKLGAELYSP